MKWPDPAQLNLPSLPEGYTIVQLSRPDVEELARRVLDWHPNIRYGDGARFTRTAYYLDSVSLKHEVERDSVVYVGRKEGELVCMVCLERDPDTQNLYGRIGIVDARHRRSGLGVVVMELMEQAALLQGMASIHTYATLNDSAVQHLLERVGFCPVGIVLGRDREFIQGSNEIVRVPEVLYIKYLPHQERDLTPSPENMTPRVQRLWQSMNQ
ncbi:GNAT family N-acetyltransferase [Pseudomonas sp. SDO5271_S396]